ncbi:MAG: DEAD/DEAH box helicase [Chitinophagaceae bacterium]
MINFSELNLCTPLLKAVSELGFETPTQIQQKTIPAILDSKEDIVALAQTGTGKTAGFGLPILQQIDIENSLVQAIVLSPTRELCLQIAKDLESYSKYMPHLSIVAVYGGSSIDIQIRQLKRGAHIVVGTPGRTLDLIKRKILKINHIKWVVLDEADEMLNMGFREDLNAILKDTPDEKQTLLFSATMPDGIKQMSKNYMKKPIEITIGKKNTGSADVDHQYFLVRYVDRYQVLKRLADIHANMYGIVFCRTREECKDISSLLDRDRYRSASLHGDLSQAQRDEVMKRFRKRQLQLLVATDVAARGIDVNELTHVINYNLPDDSEVYIHRSGRTGRAGNKGISIVFVDGREFRRVKELERITGKSFYKQEVPPIEQVIEKKLYNFVNDFHNIEINNAQIEPIFGHLQEQFAYLEKEDILKKLFSLEIKKLNLSDKITPVITKGNHEKNFLNRGQSRQYVSFFISLGSNQGIKPNNLIGFINDYTQNSSIKIGKIEMQSDYSIVDIENNAKEEILKAFEGHNITYRGDKVTVRLAKENHTKEFKKKTRWGGGRDRDRFKNQKFAEKRKKF